MPKIFSIIVTYNGEKWIRKCLGSLSESTIKTHVIAIDNKSTDNTVRIIEQEFDWVELIKLDKNFGFGQANNIGIKLAIQNSADYVFLLNQDAWLAGKNTLARLVEIAILQPNSGILSPVHLNGTGNNLDFGFINYLSPFYNCNLLNDCILSKKNTAYETNFVNAASWLITKNALNIVGGFDPLFFHYGEDVNYCQRIKYHGLKILICINSFIYHDRQQDDLNIYKDKLARQKLQYLISFLDVNNINAKNKLNKTLLRFIIKAPLYQFLGKGKYLHSIIKQLILIKNHYQNSITNNKQKKSSWLN